MSEWKMADLISKMFIEYQIAWFENLDIDMTKIVRRSIELSRNFLN